MNDGTMEVLLVRIAVALERIALHFDAKAQMEEVLHTDSLVHVSQVEDDSLPVIEVPAELVLASFLSSKGIRIKNLPTEDPADHVIDSLSVYLGERYDSLSNILAKIKRAMQTGMTITDSLKNRTQCEVSDVCQFCSRLHEIAFLEQYQYLRSPTYLIRAKTTTLPKAQRFFGGQWLERFMLQKLKSVYNKVVDKNEDELVFEYLINPQIILPNGDDFELDILAAIGPHIYWIEAKSGNYQQHAAKYSKMSRLMGLDSEHAIMILTDVADDRCNALSSLFAMTVCNLATIEDRLLAIIQNDMAD